MRDPGPAGSDELGAGGEPAELIEAAAVGLAAAPSSPAAASANRRFARTSGLLLVTSLVARTGGFFRDTVIADKFGATGLTDAYFVANVLPTFLNGVLQGSLGSVVVPTVSPEFARGDPRRAYALLAGLAAYLGVAVIAFCLLVTLLAPEIVRVVAPGLTHPQVAARLARILVWTVAFSAFAYLGAAALMAGERYVYMSIGPIFMSGSATLILLVFRHPPIDYLALGLLFGNILQFGFQVVPHLRRRMLPRLRQVPVRDPAVRRMLGVAWPSLISSSVGQVNVVVDRLFGSLLAAGSISDVTYADRLIQVPLALFGTAVANASYPEMAQAWAAGEMERLRQVMLRDLRTILLFTVPITGLLVSLAAPLVSAVFQHGHMSPGMAAVVVSCLLAYTGSLVPYSVRTVLNRGFFVAGQTHSLARISVWMVVLNAAGDAILSRLIGAPGLALGTTIDQWISIVATFWLLRGILPGVPLRQTADAFLRAVAGTVPLAVVAHLVAGDLAATSAFFAHGVIGRVVNVLAASGAGLAAAGIAFWAVRYPGLDTLVRRLANRLRRLRGAGRRAG